MDLKLVGKKAIVTGGTRGIGRAIVEELVREGCREGICARNASDVDATIASLHSMGAFVTGKAVDVKERETLKLWIEETVKELGGLDILIPNPSGYGVTSDYASWQRNFDIDVMGAVNSVEAALPWLVQSESAAIVFIASIYALECFVDVNPQGYTWPYAAMKAAIINYAGNLSRSLASQGVRVNVVSPGPIYFIGSRWEKTKTSIRKSI